MVSLISSKKLTKTHCILVETNSFVHFLEEFAAWQFAFEIVWPLTNKTNYNLLKKSWIFYSCIFEKILHEHKITIQLIIGFVPIVYKSNLEAQNHVLEIIYTLHPKLQGTPMTKKKHQHFCLIKNATTSIPDSESSLELRSKIKVDFKKIHMYTPSIRDGVLRSGMLLYLHLILK